MNTSMNTTMNQAPQAPFQPPKPPKVGRPDGLAPNLKDAPEDVRWGVLAWVITAALQMLYALVQFVANLTDSRALYAQIKQQLDGEGSGPNVAKLLKITGANEQDSINQLVTLTNLMMTGWMIFIAVLCAWLATRAGRGGNYSRMFLTVGSIYLAINAILAVFSSAPDTMNVGIALAVGVLTILSGVVAVVGVYFMTRPGNAKWLGIPSAKQIDEYRKQLQHYQDQVDEHKKATKQKKKDQQR